jgi:hypothetical protein
MRERSRITSLRFSSHCFSEPRLSGGLLSFFRLHAGARGIQPLGLRNLPASDFIRLQRLASAASMSAIFPVVGAVSVLATGWISDRLGPSGRSMVMVFCVDRRTSTRWLCLFTFPARKFSASLLPVILIGAGSLLPARSVLLSRRSLRVGSRRRARQARPRPVSLMESAIWEAFAADRWWNPAAVLWPRAGAVLFVALAAVSCTIGFGFRLPFSIPARPLQRKAA